MDLRDIQFTLPSVRENEMGRWYLHDAYPAIFSDVKLECRDGKSVYSVK